MCLLKNCRGASGDLPGPKGRIRSGLHLIPQGGLLTGMEIADIYHERLKFSGSLAALFDDVDLLLISTMPVPIPTLQKMSEYGADPQVLLSILRFTAVFDFSGSPTITLPMGLTSDQMPLSMQSVGPHLSSRCSHGRRTLSRSMTDRHIRRPPLSLPILKMTEAEFGNLNRSSGISVFSADGALRLLSQRFFASGMRKAALENGCWKVIGYLCACRELGPVYSSSNREEFVAAPDKWIGE